MGMLGRLLKLFASRTGPAADPRLAPFKLQSIHFDFPGGTAIRLRDPETDEFLGARPEWIAESARNEPAAYVRNSQPEIQVVFRGHESLNGEYKIGASGTPVQIEERTITLGFDPNTGLTAPTPFRLKANLPNRIERLPITLEWYSKNAEGRSAPAVIGKSTHAIHTTWRPMRPSAGPGTNLQDWVYKQLVEWTCEWATGAVDEKDICDAIITNLHKSQLRYGIEAHEVRRMLNDGGGMCGGWYSMFQQMAHCQGVFVHRRSFRVHLRQMPNGEEHWWAIVVCKGGLNQPFPTSPEMDFQDDDSEFPINTAIIVIPRRARRYSFWAGPAFFPGFIQPDGHCINFLEHGGRVYIYDACFAIEPIELRSSVPPDDFSVHAVSEFPPFKTDYLDSAVDYMLGTIYNGTMLYRAKRSMGMNGMTVKTQLIPGTVNGRPGVTFMWGP
jgi:hypothetical protein